MGLLSSIIGTGFRRAKSEAKDLSVQQQIDLEELSKMLADHYLSEKLGTLEENQAIQSYERKLFRAVSEDPNLRTAIAAWKDPYVEVRRIYIALIMAGAGQLTNRGWVPLLAITHRRSLKYLYKRLKHYDASDMTALPEPSERVKNAAWKTLELFR